MATLSDNSKRVFKYADDGGPAPQDMPIIASDIIYEGAAVGESASTGNARPLVGGDSFVGFAYAKADNSAGAVGDVNVRLRQRGEVKLTVTGVTADDDFGIAIYASDDDTFTTTASGASQIGKLVRWVTSTTCYVYFEGVQVRSV